MTPRGPRTTVADLPELLHDARLENGVWLARERTLTLRFYCLRRHVDGTEMDAPEVELMLEGVCAVALSLDTSGAERPSSLAVGPETRAMTLEPWPWSAQEVAVTVNSALDLETLDVAAQTIWLHGSRADVIAPIQLCVHPTRLAGQDVELQLWIAANHVDARASGRPLPLDRWMEEFAAWWKALDENTDEDDRHAQIPAGRAAPSLDYTPPDEPPFEILDTDLPRELQATLCDWFEGLVLRDWARRTRAGRNLDLTWEENLAMVEHSSLTDGFGAWGYARSVDGWWVEGHRAFVQVRGIEHSMPVDDDPAENVEAVWGFELRRRGDAWHIVASSSGYPAYGSAPTRPVRDKPWLQRWRSGTVKSARIRR